MDVYVWVHYMCSSTFRDVPYTFILVSNSEVQALALLHIHTHTHLYIYTQIYILHITNWISTFCVHTSALVCVYASAPCATASLTSAYACFPKPFVVLHAATLISLHFRPSPFYTFTHCRCLSSFYFSLPFTTFCVSYICLACQLLFVYFYITVVDEP